MSAVAEDVWAGRSVLFKSFYGWTPATWAALGWSNPGRRETICNTTTDPFILVCSVTLSAPGAEAHERGKIVGFYLVSHERGDRDQFTHPSEHTREPTHWRYALRAIRAFDYLPEYRLDIRAFDASLFKRAQPVATHGEIISDPVRLDRLRRTPWEEVEVYRRGRSSPGNATADAAPAGLGLVRAGPENTGGYLVPPITQGLPRHLYILRLDGPVDSFLGMSASGRHIVKIGLAASPESRRAQFQRALPRGAFAWKMHRTTLAAPAPTNWTFRAAEAGEYAMKCYLATNAKHLDGEFYLASDEHIHEAWRLGVAAAQAMSGEAS